MASGLAEELAPDIDALKDAPTKSIRAEWAHEQYARALDKLTRVCPITSLDALKQGDVMFSKSGNVRLVIDAEKRGADTFFTFLSRLRDGKIKIENALLRKIDIARLDSVVVRRFGSPLAKFYQIAKRLADEKTILHNITALLQAEAAGEQVTAALAIRRRDQYGFVTVPLRITPTNGRIEGVGREQCEGPQSLVSLSFNGLKLPAEDYIKSAVFQGDLEADAKTNLLAACVFANTLENARNLVCMAQMAEL